ncbi:MAG TPA: histidine triad nucleotide-binding protein [Candidatus Baltobacteraceae bacterium]|nr:histidine triad nucleotide-binding protein [Candidatus Baltobacteraceae bacterium]
MNDDCIFCKIASGAIPAKTVHRDDDVLAIEDVNPQAPVHLLVMPVRHHPNIAALSGGDDVSLLARLFEVASRLGRERGGDGFRLVVNTGPDGGQTVDHLHVHVLAGRHMTWPPG